LPQCMSLLVALTASSRRCSDSVGNMTVQQTKSGRGSIGARDHPERPLAGVGLHVRHQPGRDPLYGSLNASLAHPALIDLVPRSISTNRSYSRIQPRHEFRAFTFCHRDPEWQLLKQLG
jgi:hypothetical protein